LNKVEKVKCLGELFELIQYYYEYRDQPVKGPAEDFASRVEACCNALEIDLEEFKKEFRVEF